MSLDALAAFPGAAKYYVAERYALKERFIALNAEAKLRLFGHSPYPKVLVGRNKTLFLGDDAAVAGAQGATPAPRASDTAWLALFNAMDAAFAARNVPLIQIIAPDKNTVLPELLPPWLTLASTPRVSVIVAQLQDLSGPHPVDLARYFAQIRRTNQDASLYHRTDTHWTEFGAALAMDANLAPLLEPTPGLPPLTSPERADHGGDLARMIGQQDEINDLAPRIPRPARLSCATPEGAAVELASIDPLPTARFTCHNPLAPANHALVFMDSFGMAASPRLVQIFRQVDFVWNDTVDMALVDEIRPDITIRIMVARKLQSADPAQMLRGE
ncbi:alginate O-acetyltransferase AlgX-related protein [Loktanella sp. DJP18]|uniref:alginate O-acetyltransferase AlgX-related protein n=1 Tax=Loktanella sp. DJP18 TaxID=3409788 RepID=UPI003BB4C111